MQKKDCRHREQLEACAEEKLTPICRGETEAKARDLAHQEAVSSMTRTFLKWRASRMHDMHDKVIELDMMVRHILIVPLSMKYSTFSLAAAALLDPLAPWH